MCYRRNGHNENDNPYVTQPIMYKAIEKQKPVMEKYAAELISSGVVTTDDYKVCTHTVPGVNLVHVQYFLVYT